MKKNANTRGKEKIHIVIGTKAQLIKMAPLMYLLEKKNIPYNFIFTGQHQKTIKDIRANFHIKEPDTVLHQGKDITGIFQMLVWLLKISGKVIVNRRRYFPLKSKKQILLTHGDTFSTLLGAIMGKLAGIKVAHVESGLRSFNIFHPFPEELTRIFTFQLSDIYFCPGDWAAENLKKYRGEKVNTEENTMLDSLKFAKENFDHIKVNMPKEKYCIVSTHRFENIFKKQQLERICKQIMKIKNSKVLFILHPPTEIQLKKFGLYEKLSAQENIELRPRYDYFQFVKLLYNAEFLITDGGSNQEESYYMGKPCLLLRKKTERKEGLGKNVVLSEYKEEAINQFVNNYQDYKIEELKPKESPCEKIIETILKITQ